MRRNTDLADAGGEGAADGFKPSLPIVGIANLWLGRGDHQQRNVLCVGEGFVFLIAVEVVVAADAGIQNRIRYSLDHIAVVVSAAQPLRSQHIERLVPLSVLFTCFEYYSYRL